MLTLADILEATGGELHGGQPNLEACPSHVVADSRSVTAGALFVAIKGEHHDGHDFVGQAFKSGAIAALVERVSEFGGPVVVVSSTVDALGKMARFAFDQVPNLDVVGITGSLGKTTTKEVTASVLSSHRQVLRSQGNLNSEIGLPLTVLNGLEPSHQIAVLEMAMYQPGDIRLLARLARPRIGVVTAVLPVHLERVGTIERIQQAKQELVEELPSNGVAVLNADDPRVAGMVRATAARVVRYGVVQPADVRAERIESRGLDGVDFDLLHNAERRRVHLPLLGAQSVHAALAAAAVALEEGFTLSDVVEGLQQVSPALRMLVVDGINGSRILDDSYNASPESVLAALELLRELPGERKIAVLGDMLELGSEEVPSHKRVGSRAASLVDLLVVYGPRSTTTAREARRAGLSEDRVIEAGTREQIVDYLTSELRPGDDVLVKGSLGMGMSYVVRGIRAEGGA